MGDYYVDPSLGTDTGSGTVGDPWGHTGNEIQKALDNITQGTYGDKIHIKSTGTVDFSGTNLDFTTYGTPTFEKPIAFVGYDSVAWDGGLGNIDLNGASTFVASSVVAPQYWFLDISGGTGAQTNGDSKVIVYGCHLDSTDGANCAAGGGLWVMNSYLLCAGNNKGLYRPALFLNNYMKITNFDVGIDVSGPVIGNLFVRTTAGAQVMLANLDNANVVNNSIYSSVAGTGQGIYVGANVESALIQNNYVEGLSGAGGTGYYFAAGSVVSPYRNNRWYNCTSGESLNGTTVGEDDNSVLTASGFNDASSEDYTPTSELRGAGGPTSIPNLSGNAKSIDIGAIQAVIAAGGVSIVNTRRNSMIGR